jgi:tetratricopeptide (TPR) repeat protein
MKSAIQGRHDEACRNRLAGLASQTNVLCLCLAALTVCVFWQTRQFDFIELDDPDYITANSQVLSGLTWDGIRWAFGAPHVANWHPLTWLSLMADMNLFGHGPFGPHTVNLLFHVADTLLLYLACKALSGAHWRSALVAALFAVHPLHIESVAWVSERKDMLSAFFFFLALLAYVRYAQSLDAKTSTRLTQSGTPVPSPAFSYGLTLLWFVLGLLCKPMVVTLPFVLLLLDYWPLGRLFSDATSDFGESKGFSVLEFWKRLREKLPLLGISAAFCFVTLAAQRETIQTLTALPLKMRIENTFVSYARYVSKTLWPVNLALPYPYPKQWPGATLLLAITLVLGISGLALVFGRRNRFLITGWFWFIGMLVPVIGLVQVGNQALADRYMYLPSIGLFIMIAWGIYALATRWALSRFAVALSLGAMVAACSLRTLDQLQHWRNSEQLFKHALKVTHDNSLALDCLASYFAKNGRTDEAIDTYRKAVDISPEPSGILNNLANLLAAKKEYSQSAFYYQEALRIKPNYVMAHCNLGVSLFELGKTNEAFSHCLEAVRLAPDSPLTHYRLGNLYLRVRQMDDAVAHFQSALLLMPNYVNGRIALGTALAQAGRPDEAAAQFNQALQYDPGNPAVHVELGNLLVTQRKWQIAVDHFKVALNSDPNSAEAQLGLSQALSNTTNRCEAIPPSKQPF